MQRVQEYICFSKENCAACKFKPVLCLQGYNVGCDDTRHEIEEFKSERAKKGKVCYKDRRDA